MPSLRTNTALFLLLTALPACILAWLGLRAPVPLVAELRQQARTEAARVIADVEPRLQAGLRTGDDAVTKRLAALAARLRDSVPADADLRALAAHEAEFAPHGALRLRAAGGGVLWPRDPVAADFRHLPEWSRFVRLRARCDRRDADPAAFECARSFEAPPLRVLATCLVAAEPAERLAGLLAAEPWSAIAAAGPQPCELLELSEAGRRQLAAALGAGGLYVVPATEHARAAWLRAAGAGASALARQGLRVRAEDGESLLCARVPVGDAATLEWLRDPEVALGELAPTVSQADGDCDVTFAMTASPATAITFEPAGGARLVTATVWGRVAITATSRGLVALEATAGRQRWWTGVGIGLLLLVMAAGMALARRALLHEQRARALRLDFLANVSHELKTPLTSLRLHAELLADAAVDGAARERYGAVAQAEGARLSALVDDLLDFAALERGRRRIEPEPVDLARAARDLVAAWQPLAARDGVALRCVTADGEVLALADPTALSRILMNLLQNALRHGRPARDGGPDWIEVRTGPGPWFEVRDSGPGIGAVARERLFQRFERGGSGRGLGLGLALSRELAEACGGRLSYVTDAPVTTFRLELPPVPDLP
ncbi:MAG TPA: HAMP domain-containing sensor histidine kinase [Planctomycetota bacterium]|nr:HAMP domain-containing sensor histidine kinase [Planctomycetota bacterium]